MSSIDSKGNLDVGELQSFGDSPFVLSSFSSHDVIPNNSIINCNKGDLFADEKFSTLKSTADGLSPSKRHNVTQEELRSIHAQSLMQLSCHLGCTDGSEKPEVLENECKDEFPSLTLRKHHFREDDVELADVLDGTSEKEYMQALNDYQFGK